MGENEIKLGPLSLKGKDAFSYLGWLLAIGCMGYAAWGPPSSIRDEQTKQSVSIQAITTDMAVVKEDVAKIKQELRPFLADARRGRTMDEYAKGLDETAHP